MADQIEGRNVVLEALRRGRRRVLRVRMDERAREDDKISAILALCREKNVPVERLPREVLDRQSETGAHNGVLALAEGLVPPTVAGLLDDLTGRKEDPFLVLVDEVQYEQNLGAILRCACGAGAHAVVVPVRRGKGLSAVVQRVAMGAAEEVPLVREGLLSAVATLRRAGVRIVGLDMDGTPIWKQDLTGPVALVLGGEDKGLSPPLRARCDAVVGVPLDRELESLNVGVTAGIAMFEKVRQERDRVGRGLAERS